MITTLGCFTGRRAGRLLLAAASCLIGLTLSVAACSGDDQKGSPSGQKARYELLDEGSGPSNTEPLWPMRPGARWNLQAADPDVEERAPEELVVGITRVSDRFGKPWLLQQVVGSTGRADIFTQGLGWNQGKQESYWSMDEEGLVLRAIGTNDPLEVPLLVIPAEVKPGMKWMVHGDSDEALLTGEIQGGDLQDTPWGQRRVWRVDITVPERNPWGGSVSAANGYPLPTHWSQEFVEGRGPINATQAVVPLEDREVTLPKRVAMQPLPELPRQFKGRVAGFSVTQDAATGRLEPQLGIRIPGVVPTKFFRTLANGNSEIRVEYVPDRRICYRTDGSTVEEIDPTVYELDPPKPWDWTACQDANGVLYTPEGTMATRVPFKIDGSAPGDWFFDFGPGIQIMGYSSIGTFMSTEPYWGAMGITRDNGIFAGGMKVVDALNADYDLRPDWKKTQNPNWGTFLFGLGPWSQQWEIEAMSRAVGLAPEADKKLDFLFQGDGLLGHGRAEAVYAPQYWNTTHWWWVSQSGLDFHTYDEFVVVTYTDNHRDVFQVSEDGLIWRIQSNDNAVTRTLAAAVQVPDEHQVIGVVPVSQQELQVWTQKGFVWEGSQNVWGVGPVDIYTDDISQHVWTVQTQQGSPEPPPLAGELFLQASGPDVLVCAPVGHTLPTEGWLLGAQEPTVLNIDDRCILLMRPLPEYAEAVPAMEDADLIPQDPTAWVIEGTLPDVGEVALMLVPSQPQVPTDLRVAKDGTIYGGELGSVGLDQTGVVRMWGAGKAMIEHFWGPTPANTCSKYAWEVQIWDESSMPDVCEPPKACYGVVRIGKDTAESKTFPLPEGTLSSFPYGGEGPSMISLPDGCALVKWGTWYYRLDEELGPVEIEDPFALPTSDWAKCELMDIDHNYLLPDVDRYSCELFDGTSKTVELPPWQRSNMVLLPDLNVSYYLTKTNEPYLWRFDEGTWEFVPVKVPASQHFGRKGIWDLDGFCGADGACYLLLVGRSDDGGGAIPWAIVRADDLVSGLHPVYEGWASDLAVPEEIVGDDEMLLVTGSNRVLWRGWRDLEPSSCVGCTAAEECLSGFCDCDYGQVRNDGYCDSSVPAESYYSCAEALDSGVASGVPVRIDGDGPEWPSPQFITVCESGSPWTEAPVDFSLTSAVGSVSLNNTCHLAGSSDFGWDSSMAMLLMSGNAGIHGEFEMTVDLGEPFIVFEQNYTRDTMLVLDDPSKFDPVTGRYSKACGHGEAAAVDNEIQIDFYQPGTLVIDTDSSSTFEGTWEPGTLMRITREADGFIRIYAGEMLYWTSERAYKNDFRPFRMDHKILKVLSLHWKGSQGGFCMPRCEGMECGPDQCGGSCGECVENAHCAEGLCVCDDPRFFSNEEKTECVFPAGSYDYPAASCMEASLVPTPWKTTPWIDPDGAGGEPAFQMTECATYSPWNMEGLPWTLAPNDFLGGSALMVMNQGLGTCSTLDAFTPAFSAPLGMSGSSAYLDGSLVPAGLTVAATSRFVSGQFTVGISLYPGQAGEEAAVYLDGLESFSAAAAAWVGWAPECGKSVDLSHRVVLKATPEGIWLGLGEGAPALLGPSSYGYVSLTRLESGAIEVRLSDGTVASTVPSGILPDQSRLVGVVQSASGCKVVISKVQWM